MRSKYWPRPPSPRLLHEIVGSRFACFLYGIVGHASHFTCFDHEILGSVVRFPCFPHEMLGRIARFACFPHEMLGSVACFPCLLCRSAGDAQQGPHPPPQQPRLTPASLRLQAKHFSGKVPSPTVAPRPAASLFPATTPNRPERDFVNICNNDPHTLDLWV